VAEGGVDLAGAAFGGDKAFDDGEGFGVGDGFGGNGVSIAISSETVTNLNPFASNSFKTQGIASIVPG
jgi:hypothetical protein